MEHQPLRGADVRDRNQKLILRLLFQHGALSQSHVVNKTGLKAPTVFRIFSKLEEDRYIRPCKNPAGDSGQESERKGRRPSYYCVVPNAAYAVGVDFSTSGASVIIADFVNEVIFHQVTEFAPGIDRDEILAQIRNLIDLGIDRAAIDRSRIVGIGIGAPGTVDTATGVVVDYARIAGLAGYSLKDHFEALFKVPVLVHNNASVIAASEYHYATAKEFDSVLAVLVRAGVGAAFVNHGRIFLNGTTTALEIGRTSTCLPDGPAEAPQAPSLESIVGELPMLELIARTENIGSWPEAETRLEYDRIAELLAGPATVLATSVRNLYHVVHPDAVLVISRFTKLAQTLAAAVAAAVPEVTALPIVYDPVKACFGATDLVFQQFFS
jgi:predicted NBD/HSP70 family sugar kinase